MELSFSVFVVYSVFCLVFILAIGERLRSFKRCLLAGIILIVCFLSIHYYLYITLIPKLFMFYFPITGLMAGMFYSIYVSPHDGAKAIFPFLVSIFFVTVTDSIIDIITWGTECRFPETLIIQVICLAISLAITEFFLRDFFLTALRYANSGWNSMDMSFFIYFFIMDMMIITLREYNILYIRVGLEILMLVIFVALCYMTAKSLHEQEKTYQDQMMAQQGRAFIDQAAMFWESEKQMAILRHDMRHRIGLIRELIKEGNTQDVFELLDDTDDRLEKSKSVKYCENVYVNAALVMCTHKAAEEGIDMDIKTDIRENTALDVHMLAVVISNLVENGINACRKLGDDKKKFINVVARDTGASLIVWVKNSCTGKISFDDNGLPVSKKEGHGIGTKSVISFIEAYDGIIDYSVDSGVFSVKILVNYM